MTMLNRMYPRTNLCNLRWHHQLSPFWKVLVILCPLVTIFFTRFQFVKEQCRGVWWGKLLKAFWKLSLVSPLALLYLHATCWQNRAVWQHFPLQKPWRLPTDHVWHHVLSDLSLWEGLSPSYQGLKSESGACISQGPFCSHLFKHQNQSRIINWLY